LIDEENLENQKEVDEENLENPKRS
jgi:hypothetical protein